MLQKYIRKQGVIQRGFLAVTQPCNDCPNVSTNPLQNWGFRQCLPFSSTTLRGKHYRHSITVMRFVDTFGHCLTGITH